VHRNGGQLFTLYIFYELLTFSTLFLVAHGLSARSLYAARKYLYYSLGGAALAFITMIGVLHYGGTVEIHLRRHTRAAQGAARVGAYAVHAGLYGLRGQGGGLSPARLAAHGDGRPHAGHGAFARVAVVKAGVVFHRAARLFRVRGEAAFRHLGNKRPAWRSRCSPSCSGAPWPCVSST
jgi:hypothetical protein